MSETRTTIKTVDPYLCGCSGCKALLRLYGPDAELVAFYAKKLLIRGWAAGPLAGEKAYQRAHSPGMAAASERGKALAAKSGGFRKRQG